MPGKRQHYVPRFLLRRFSTDPGAKKAPLYRLAKATGRPQKVNPINEVVERRYYRLTFEDGSVDDSVDELLDRFEDQAAKVIERLVDSGYVPSAEERFHLTNFVVTLMTRTPRAREALRETDEQISALWLELMLSDPERYHRMMGSDAASGTEAEQRRLQALADLNSGRLIVESSSSREVGMMFVAFKETAEAVFDELEFVLVRVPRESRTRFVLSDHPVSHYDPAPKVPEAGASFMSSSKSMTFVPLDPNFGLLLVQGRPGAWRERWSTDTDVEKLNLLTYAWAKDAIYGPSQESVAGTRRLAKAERKLVHEYRYRAPTTLVQRCIARRHPGRDARVHQPIQGADGSARTVRPR